MRILIFCTLKEEARSLIHAIQVKKSSPNLYIGSYLSHSIQLVITGPGQKNVERWCDRILENSKGVFPELVISAGFCGGLDPRLLAGDLVIANQILLLGKKLLEIEPSILKLDFQYEKEIQKGNSFIVLKRSKPLFKIIPIHEEEWEEVIDFTKFRKNGISAEELISRLQKMQV